MENTSLIQSNPGIKVYLKAKAAIQNNPLFEDSLRTMSGGDYINIHQRQQNMSSSRFSWLMPDED